MDWSYMPSPPKLAQVFVVIRHCKAPSANAQYADRLSGRSGTRASHSKRKTGRVPPADMPSDIGRCCICFLNTIDADCGKREMDASRLTSPIKTQTYSNDPRGHGRHGSLGKPISAQTIMVSAAWKRLRTASALTSPRSCLTSPLASRLTSPIQIQTILVAMAATARWASLALPRPSPGIDLSSQSELFADVRAPQQSHQGSPTSSTSSSAGQYRSSLRFEDSRMPRWHCGPLWVKMTAATVLRVSSMCTGDPNLVKFFFHMCAQANPTTGFHREHEYSS